MCRAVASYEKSVTQGTVTQGAGRAAGLASVARHSTRLHLAAFCNSTHAAKSRQDRTNGRVGYVLVRDFKGQKCDPQ